MIAFVLMRKYDGTPFGVAVVNKPDSTMYDQHDAIKLWLETHLHATQITFIHGGEVHYTAGGLSPYRAEALISRSLTIAIVTGP